MRTNSVKWIRRFYTILGCLIVVVVNLLVQSTSELPITVDEIGYISYPALIAGYRWNNVLSYVPYYGFGYGLLLIPVFLMCKTMEQIYVIIRILNYLLIFIIFLVLRKLDDDTEENNLLNKTIYSSICCIIPSILSFKNYALSEILIIAIYLLTVLTLKEYIKSGKTKWKILFAILNIYLLMIHLRTVGIVFLSFAIIIFLDKKSIKKRIADRKSKLIFLIVAIMLVILLFMFKYIIKIFEIGKLNDTNSLVSQIARIMVLFDFERMKSFLLLMGSRIWTYIVSYFGLFAIGMGVLVSSTKKEKEHRIIYIYIIFSFILEFLINCIAMSAVVRLDMIFYTRYSEFCIMPMLYFGIKHICEKKIALKNIFIICFIMLCTYQSVHFLFNTNEQISEFLTICVPNISMWWQDGRFLGELATKIIMVFLFGVYLVSHMKKVWTRIILVLFIAIMWVNTASNSFRNYEKTLTIEKYDFEEEIEYVAANNIQKIYAVVGTNEYYVGRHYECWLQLAMPYMEIECIPIEDCYNCTKDENTAIIIPQRLAGLDEQLFERYFQCATEYFCFLGK